MKEIKKREDFEVEECLVQFYQRDELNKSKDLGNYPNRGWWWHCITCDDATAKYTKDGRRRKLRAHGHKTEADAMCGATMHAKQKRTNRQWAAWRKWWNKEFYTTKDVEYFGRLWNALYGFGSWSNRRTDLTEEQIMRYMQTGKVEELDMHDKHLEIRSERVRREL